MTARNDALAHASLWLEKHSGLGWTPDPQYLLERALVRFSEAEDKVFEEPMGKMKVVKMQLDVSGQQARDIQKQAQQQRMKERQKSSLHVVFGVACLLGVVGGYLHWKRRRRAITRDSCGSSLSASFWSSSRVSGSLDKRRCPPRAIAC